MKDVNMVESSNKIAKVSNMDVEEKEFVEEDKLGSKLLVGKQAGKGAVHETMKKFEEGVYTTRKSLDKKWKQVVGPHIKGGPMDDIGMVQTKKLAKLNHLVTTLEVKKRYKTKFYVTISISVSVQGLYMH
jgi:hypothetical protein